MRNVQTLVIDDKQILDDITAAKRQPRRGYLQAVRTNVLLAYAEYVNAAPEIGNLPKLTFSKQEKEALIHAFEVETAPMLTLRGDLLKRITVARCPFCGISESSTLDHYLPKELNPQFSIFSKNLVPCCGICNTRKRDRILDEHNLVRLFLHPHFDDIPQALFMKVDITLLPDAIALRYSLFQPAGVTMKTFQQLQSHFKILGLADRYRKMSLERLRAQYGAIARLYGVTKDADRVAGGLLKKAKQTEEEYGKNYWLAVFYNTLARNRQFCDGGFEVLIKIQ